MYIYDHAYIIYYIFYYILYPYYNHHYTVAEDVSLSTIQPAAGKVSPCSPG